MPFLEHPSGARGRAVTSEPSQQPAGRCWWLAGVKPHPFLRSTRTSRPLGHTGGTCRHTSRVTVRKLTVCVALTQVCVWARVPGSSLRFCRGAPSTTRTEPELGTGHREDTAHAVLLRPSHSRLRSHCPHGPQLFFFLHLIF